MISHSLLAELSVVLPPRDTEPRELRAPVVEEDEPRDEDRPRRTLRPDRLRVGHGRPPSDDRVIAILRADPEIGAHDVVLALRARGSAAYRVAVVAAVLGRLYREGRLLRTKLNGRDARRAGCRYVYSVTP